MIWWFLLVSEVSLLFIQQGMDVVFQVSVVVFAFPGSQDVLGDVVGSALVYPDGGGVDEGFVYGGVETNGTPLPLESSAFRRLP